ncbi:hypothetical protein [Breoghania sp. L-A4]|uniref:hypothetical protein n=1 Tax=Breoghania sp. L-A4 TaxID=2304600 RepID=UPI000E35ABF1|nr:hypothetical protein [Breoghania sp. L-A4]AXS40783.1 hypothetical protein D1F64_12910 [Breoghania sp. L-A4]
MTLLIFTGFLWGSMLTLGVIAARRGDGTFAHGVRLALREATFIAPRLFVGILGAGFVAELLPADTVRAFLGSGSGSLGILIATLAGGIVPGGPVVAYAVGGAALEAGAGVPQVMAFVTAWLLFSVNRTFVWEVSVMGGAYVRARMMLSLPVPLAVGHLALLLPL